MNAQKLGIALGVAWVAMPAAAFTGALIVWKNDAENSFAVLRIYDEDRPDHHYPFIDKTHFDCDSAFGNIASWMFLTYADRPVLSIDA